MNSNPRPACFADNHDPFWPTVDLGAVRERVKLQRQVSDAALDVAARCAVIGAASEFAHWRTVLRARGYKRLEDLARHNHGRALRVCYIRFVEAAVMHSLGSTAKLRVPQRRAANG